MEAEAAVSGHVSPGACLQCVVPDISHFYPPGCSWLAQPTQVRARTILHIRAANDPSVFTITEKAPTSAFSWLKVPTSALAFKTLLRHHATVSRREIGTLVTATQKP